MAQTDRLDLPLIAAGQAQKEITHNEALGLIDIMVQLVVESAGLAMPPASPSYGQCWIVGTGGTGAWSGKDGVVAGWTANGWLFAVPRVGWRAWAIDRGNVIRFDGTSWGDDPVRNDGFYVAGVRVLAGRQAAIVDPSGGATQDGEARVAISAILNVLRAHGLIES
jgi:hypothetical protein